MSLKSVVSRHQAWKTALEQACEPLLQQARAGLVTAQSAPEADNRIERIEELLRAKLEPALLEHEQALEPIQQAVDQYFETAEEPSEQDTAVQQLVGEGIGPMRDRLDRRIASLVAQARAGELLPVAGGAAAAPSPSSAQRPAAAASPPVVAASQPTPPAAQAPVPAPPPGMRRFCIACGGKLGPADWAARRCPACAVAL